VHPGLSWIRGHPRILENMDPLIVSFCLFIHGEVVGCERRRGRTAPESYNDEEQGRLFCLGEVRRRRKGLYRPALHPLAASNRTVLVSFCSLALLFAII
jgi:hypothetical protein